MADSDTSLSEDECELIDLDVEGWIETVIINSCLDKCYQLIRFRKLVDFFTRKEYLKFRLKNWRQGWKRFLLHIETSVFEQRLRKYLIQQNMSKIFVDQVLVEYREEFLQTVKGEEKNLNTETNSNDNNNRN